jgi:hypothetical protein
METKYLGSKASYDGIRYHMHRTHMPSAQAEFAMFLLDKGQLNWQYESIDEGGSSKVPMSPHSVVQRACNIAEIAFQEFHKRGWMVETTEPTKVQVDRLINE